MGNAVSWFETPVKDMERAKAFYAEVFGYTFEMAEMGPMRLAMIQSTGEGPGVNGALVMAQGYEPSMTGTIVYHYCEDLAVQLGHAERLGVTVLVPKTSIGDYGFMAHIVDSEGNHVALHSMK